MRKPLLLLAALLALPGCTTFEADVDDGPSDALFARVKGVIGQRTVAGIEVPLVFIPGGIGLGAWVYSPPKSEAALRREELEIIAEAQRK